MTHQLTYKEIADDLQDRIIAGEYPPGTALPSYKTLCGIYGVGISTVGRAIGLLRDRSAVVGRQGRAVYVRRG